MWICKQCNEESEDNFDVCWNCGASKDGTEHENISEFIKIKKEIQEERNSIVDILFFFKGRICRFEYWRRAFPIFFLDNMILFLISYILPESFGKYVLLTILCLYYLWQILAVHVKRLHDRNRSGWFLLTSLVPFLNIWLFFEIWFLKGTEGENRFGPDLLEKLKTKKASEQTD